MPRFTVGHFHFAGYDVGMDLTRRRALLSFLGLGIAKPLLIPAKNEPVALALPPQPLHVLYEKLARDMGQGIYRGSRDLGIDACPPGRSTISYPLSIARKEIVSMAIWSDKPIALRSDWFDEVLINPREPLVWCNDYPRPCPFTRDITRLYITNCSNEQASVRVRALLT